jgi:NADH dehydrogenase
MRGFIAWLAWHFIHIWYLIGFRSRLVVLATWIWSYVSYKRGARLITSTGWKPSQSQPAPAVESVRRPPRVERRESVSAP